MGGTGTGRAKSKAPPTVNVNQKLVERILRESFAAYHPKAGELGAAVKQVKITNIPTGLMLKWGDDAFLITVSPETP